MELLLANVGLELFLTLCELLEEEGGSLHLKAQMVLSRKETLSLVDFWEMIRVMNALCFA